MIANCSKKALFTSLIQLLKLITIPHRLQKLIKNNESCWNHPPNWPDKGGHWEVIEKP